jgi:hypothetical protein
VSAPLTFEEFAARIGADTHPGQIDDGWAGECPIDGVRRGLHLIPFEDHTAEVYCVAGCEPQGILEALALPLHPAYFVGAHPGRFVLSHSLPGFKTSGSGNPFLTGTLTLDDLDALPRPEPLIEGTLDRKSEALLVGKPGSGKSFVSLDWSACIATGTPWNGREVAQGPVLYIAGEGVYGLAARLRAWEAHNGVTIGDQLAIFPNAAQPGDPAVQRQLAEAVAERDFALVVIDTLARSSAGVEENSATELGAWLGSVRAATVEAGSATSVLLIHHMTKAGGSARGSGALIGAQDVIYQADGNGSGVTLTRTKRKDGPLEDEHRFKFLPVGESVVLDPVTDTAHAPAYFDPDAIIAEEIRAYLLGAPGATQTRIEQSVEGRAADVRRVLGALIRTGAVKVESGSRNSRMHYLTDTSRWVPEEVPFGSIEPDSPRLSPRVFGREPAPAEPA